jgi:hypothetical protein
MPVNARVIHEGLDECIQNCWRCHRQCLETTVYLSAKDGDDAKQEKVRLLLSCAELCQSTANLLLIGASIYQDACRLCAAICEESAMMLGRDTEDRQLRLCFDACCQCAASCLEMAGMSPATLCSTQESELERERRRESQRDKVEEASWESFPASDPPAFSVYDPY